MLLIGFVPLTSITFAQTVMDTISIYGLKNSREIGSTVPLQVLSAGELKRLNSLTVADATRFLSGVQLKDYGGIGGLKTIDVRSMGSNHTQVFLDGVVIGNAQNGQVDLGKYSLENIAEIELYNGDRPILLQPAKAYASASSMYLSSLMPQFADGKSTNIRLGYKNGSFGLLNPSLLFQKKLNHDVNATLSAEYIKANGRYKFRLTDPNYDTIAVRENADIEALRAEFMLNGKLANGDWRTHLYTYFSDRGLPNAVVGNRLNPTAPDKGERQEDRNIFLQSSYTKRYKYYSFILNGKYAHDYTYYKNPNILKLEGPLENNYYQQEVYLSFANELFITPIWSVSLSGDWQWNKLNADLDDFAYPTRTTTLVAAATQLKTNRLTFQSSILATFLQDKTKFFASAGNKQEITPAASISWQPFAYPDFHLRAFYKNIFRMPTFNDLYYTAIGNTLLDPEYTNQFDLGLTFSKSYKGWLKYVSMQTDVYYNNVKDKIVATPADNQFRWIMYNLDRVEVKGLDLILRSGWSPYKDLHVIVGLNYTYQEALNKTTDNNGQEAFNRGEQIPYVPLHSGSVIVQTEIKNYFLNYSFIYTGERYSQAANRPENYLQPWYTHDLSIGKEIVSLKPYSIKISFEANNVLNQPYEVIRNFPMPGRNYRVRLALNY